MQHEQTAEQKAIVNHAATTRGDVLIDALAGTGKTRTLLWLMERLQQRSILVCAFNKRIVEEFKTKLPKLPKGSIVNVKTFHQLGLRIMNDYYPRLKVDADATESLIIRAEQRHSKAPAIVRRAATRLLRQFKEVELLDFQNEALVMPEPEELSVLGFEYDLFGKLDEGQIERAIELAMTGVDLSIQIDELETIDFCDMVWLPIALNLKSKSRFQAVIVDEWQDLSAPQFELIRRLVAPGGRMIMAGDIHQAIYGWRGAIGDVVRQAMLAGIAHAPASEATLTRISKVSDQPKSFPLTTTFRCSKAVTKLAQQLVPELKCTDDAEDGSVSTINLGDLPRWLAQTTDKNQIHTFVLSRTNADLLDAAMTLWSKRVKFRLNAGRDMLEPLFTLLGILDLSNAEAFRASVQSWRATQFARAEKLGKASSSWLARVDEQADMLLRAVRFSAPSGIKNLLWSILSENTSGVLLSTVHKVKGLEAERVFLLRQTFARHQPYADGGENAVQLTAVHGRIIEQEEANIEYVAITRARTHLTWVDMTKRESSLPTDANIDLKSYSIDDLDTLLSNIERQLALTDTKQLNALFERVHVELEARKNSIMNALGVKK